VKEREIKSVAQLRFSKNYLSCISSYLHKQSRPPMFVINWDW